MGGHYILSLPLEGEVVANSPWRPGLILRFVIPNERRPCHSIDCSAVKICWPVYHVH